MTYWRSIEANQLLRELRGEPRIPAFTIFIDLLKENLIVVYILAILLWAVAVPIFREEILAYVKDWFNIAG